MFELYQFCRAARFGFSFHRLDPTKSDLAMIFSWILRLAWWDIRRWNEDLLELLEAAQEDSDEKPRRAQGSRTA